MGLTERCWFHWQRYSYDQLKAFLGASSLVVTPYKWATQSGVAAMAAAAALPIVTTNVGGLAEMVQPGVNGELVPPDDPGGLASAIARIASDLDRYRPGVESWRQNGCHAQQATDAIVEAMDAA